MAYVNKLFTHILYDQQHAPHTLLPGTTEILVPS